MILIVDAYNIIHKIPSLEAKLDRDLKSARDGLIFLCRQILARRGDFKKIILVFDGNSAFRDLPQVRESNMRTIFSETDEDADERIISILEDLAQESRKCVVSDDNFVRNSARAHKAGLMTAQEFAALAPSKTPHKKMRQSKEKGLSAHLANEITAAYKKELGLD